MQRFAGRSFKRIAALILSIILINSTVYALYPSMPLSGDLKGKTEGDMSLERKSLEAEYMEGGLPPYGGEYTAATDSDAALPFSDPYRGVVIVDSQADLTNALNALNTGSENTVLILLSPVYLQTFSATMILPALDPGKEAEISAVGGTLRGIGASHIRILGNDGSYILRDMILDGGSSMEINGIGGIAAGAETLTLKNVLIEKLTTEAVAGHKNLIVEDSVFRNLKNRAIVRGSSVAIENTLFVNINISGNHGSSIISNSRLSIRSSSFINCGGGPDGTGYTHGAVALFRGGSDAELMVENCYFSDNIGNFYGGAISVYQSGGKAVVSNSYFKGNEVRLDNANGDGGAIGIKNNGQSFSLTVEGSTFYNNIARDDGGAIFVENNEANPANSQVNVAVTNSTFVENIGKSVKNSNAFQNLYDGGGAVQISLNVYAVLENNTFYGNEKGEDAYGGAIGFFVNSQYMTQQNPRYELKDNLFAGNKSGAEKYKNVHGIGRLVIKGGNIGIDNGTSLVAGLSTESVFGTGFPALEENGSSITAGCSLFVPGVGIPNIIVPTLWIAPSLTSGGRVDGIYADGQGVGIRTGDQRNKPRGLGNQLRTDAGAVDIVWAKFSANGGSWVQNEPYRYLGTLYEMGTDYLGRQDFTYAYVSADSDMVTVTPPPDPIKYGYTFIGWSDTDNAVIPNLTDGDYMPAETQVTYYAVWKPLKADITLIYWLNGGISSDSSISVSEPWIEDDIITVKGLRDINSGWEAARGYKFIGWSLNPAGAVDYRQNDYITAGISNINLYAQWEQLPSYSVLYDGNGHDSGAVPQDISIYYNGERAVALENIGVLKRNGYKFAGWNTDQQGAGTAYTAGDLIPIENGSITLYAEWIKTYTVTFEANGGSTVLPIHNLDLNQRITEPEPPVKVGYVFQGWYRDDMTFLNQWDFELDKVDGDCTLYAKWEKLYYVSYSGNGQDSGTVPVDVTSYLGSQEAVVLGNSGNLKLGGYKFIGWTLNASGTAALYQAGDKVLVVNSDIILYAKWEKLYTVKFESNGGSDVASITDIERGTGITEPKAPRKSGYEFMGWYKDNDTFKEQWIFASDQVNDDMVLFANWYKIPPAATKPDSTRGSVQPTIPTSTGIIGESRADEETVVSGFELEYDTENDYYVVLDKNEVPLGYVKSPGDFTGPGSVVPFVPRTGDNAGLVTVVVGVLGMAAAGTVIVKSYLDKKKREKESAGKK